MDALEKVLEEMDVAEADYRTDLAMDCDVVPPREFWYRWRAQYVMRRLLGV